MLSTNSIASDRHRHSCLSLVAERRKRLTRLAPHLPEPERGMLLAIFADGLPVATVAAMRGEPTWRFRRRLARLVRRVDSPEFALALAPWQLPTDETAAVARACFVHGLTVRAAALVLNVTLHTVIRERARVQALARHAA